MLKFQTFIELLQFGKFKDMTDRFPVGVPSPW